MLSRQPRELQRYALIGLAATALAVLATLVLLLSDALRHLDHLGEQELADRLAIIGLQNRLAALAQAETQTAPNAAASRPPFSRLVEQIAVIDRGFAAILASPLWLAREVDLLRAAEREWADAEDLMSAAARAGALDGDLPPPADSDQAKEHLGRAVALLERIARSASAFSVERRMTLLQRMTIAVAALTALLVSGLVALGSLGLSWLAGWKTRVQGSIRTSRSQNGPQHGTELDPLLGTAARVSIPPNPQSAPKRWGRKPSSESPRQVLGPEELLARLESDLRSAERSGPLSLIMLQVGLVGGPYAIERGEAEGVPTTPFRELIAREILPSDCLGDIGAGRFAVILYDTSRRVALAVAEQLRKALDSIAVPFSRHADSDLVIDIGVATFPEDGATAAEMVSAAAEDLPETMAPPFPAEPVSALEGRIPALGEIKGAGPGAAAETSASASPAEAPGRVTPEASFSPEDRAVASEPLHPSEHRRSEISMVFGRFLVRRGLLDERELSEVVKIQNEVNRHYGVIALEADLVSLADFQCCLAYQREHAVTFRAALLALNVVTPRSIEVLDEAVRARRLRLGEILIKRGSLSEQVVTEALRQFQGGGSP